MNKCRCSPTKRTFAMNYVNILIPAQRNPTFPTNNVLYEWSTTDVSVSNQNVKRFPLPSGSSGKMHTCAWSICVVSQSKSNREICRAADPYCKTNAAYPLVV